MVRVETTPFEPGAASERYVALYRDVYRGLYGSVRDEALALSRLSLPQGV